MPRLRTREQCEAEITAARLAYLEAVHDGDDTAADIEALVIDELLAEWLTIPLQQRRT